MGKMIKVNMMMAQIKIVYLTFAVLVMKTFWETQKYICICCYSEHWQWLLKLSPMEHKTHLFHAINTMAADDGNAKSQGISNHGINQSSRI